MDWEKETLEMYTLIQKFPKRIRLTEESDIPSWVIYALGWSSYDLLVEVEDEEGNITATNRPLSGFLTHAPRMYERIDLDLLNQLRRDRSTGGQG